MSKVSAKAPPDWEFAMKTFYAGTTVMRESNQDPNQIFAKMTKKKAKANLQNIDPPIGFKSRMEFAEALAAMTKHYPEVAYTPSKTPRHPTNSMRTA